jgi:hypothetical protein
MNGLRESSCPTGGFRELRSPTRARVRTLHRDWRTQPTDLGRASEWVPNGRGEQPWRKPAARDGW